MAFCNPPPGSPAMVGDSVGVFLALLNGLPHYSRGLRSFAPVW
jgi:hypothetical protein